MIKYLSDLGLLQKKIVIPVVSALFLLIIGAYAIYDAKENKDIDVDVTKAEKTTLDGGKKVAKEFNKELELENDLPSQEETKNFLGGLSEFDSPLDYVDKEYGKGTYDYYIRGLLPETKDSESIKVIKSGNIRYLNDKSKSKIPLDILPIKSVDNDFIPNNSYAVEEQGFTSVNKKISFGYISGDFDSDLMTGKITDSGRTNFKVSMIVYPKEDMSLGELQAEANKIPIVINGATFEPYFDYYRNFKTSKGESYSKALKDSKLDEGLSSYANLDYISENIKDTKKILNGKVYAGVGIELTYVGNVKNYFENKEAEYNVANNLYNPKTLPSNISLKINKKEKVLIKVVIEEDKPYYSIPIKP